MLVRVGLREAPAPPVMQSGWKTIRHSLMVGMLAQPPKRRLTQSRRALFRRRFQAPLEQGLVIPVRLQRFFSAGRQQVAFPVANDFGIESEAGESRKEYTGTQSSVKAKNDMAGKIPTLADQTKQIERQY